MLALLEIAATLGVFVSLGISVPAQYFAAPHVVMSVATPVRVMRVYVLIVVHDEPPVRVVAAPEYLGGFLDYRKSETDE
ncbi:MAG TPA: hypothetical protein VIV65_04740 [Gemmatimonadaceae bacterium]